MNASSHSSRKTFQHRLDHMVDRIREDILGGYYRPGDYIPSEKELVARFQLSNKSVRKGLERLIAEDLIVKVDRVGSLVKERAGAATVTVSFGYHPSIERDFQLTALLEDFQRIHPAIRIKLVKLVLSHSSSIQDYLQSGLVDVMTINNLDFTGCVDSGSTRLLDPIDADPGTYAFANEAFAHEGVQFAKPIIFSPILLAYNRDHFREANVPEPDGSWTWKDAIRSAAALTVPGKRHGLYFHLLSDNRWPAFLLQSGMHVEPDAEGVVHLAGTRLLESIRLCKEIIGNRSVFPHYMSENNQDVNELFMQGKVSMIMTNYMTLNELKYAEIDYDISPLPYLYEPRSLLNVIGMAASRHAAEKEAAKLLIDYFASPRAQRLIREHTLSLPARKEIAEQPLPPSEPFVRPSRYFLFREIMFSYRLHRELNLPLQPFMNLRQLLKRYWSDLIGEEELCEQAKDLFRSEE